MTILLTLYPVLVLGFWSKSKKHKSKGTVKCVYLPLCCDSNLEYLFNIVVWNSFLLLSCLSVLLTSVDAHSDSNLNEIQKVVKGMERVIKKSDAYLYAPLANVNNCTYKVMYCYLLELNVIAYENFLPEEQDITPDVMNHIYTLKNYYKNCSQIDSECSECETHNLVSSTVFFERLVDLTQKLTSSNLRPKDCEAQK